MLTGVGGANSRILGESQRVNPTYTVDSSSSTSCNEADSDQISVMNSEDDDRNEDDNDDSRDKRPKTRRRKRKSYSSAAEMLTFFSRIQRKGRMRRRKRSSYLKICRKKGQVFWRIFGNPEKQVKCNLTRQN